MKKLMSLAAAIIVAVTAASQPKVVAHRGYWDTPGSAQNSIASLIKADSIGADACEFDVWITADGIPVVYHDDTTPGGLRIETSTLDELRAVRLANGEPIPTLGQYLDAAANVGIPLVLELKPHTDKTREHLAIDLILSMIDERGLGERTDYITFSRPAFIELASRVAKPSGVYYLNGDLTPAEIEAAGGAGQDYYISVYRDHYPEWIEECHATGLKVNVWTVNDMRDIMWCIGRDVDFITTNDPLTVLEQVGR